jgi:type VI secretion system secreted protein Hcp
MAIRIGFLSITPESTGSPIVGPSVSSQAPETIEVLEMKHQLTHEYDSVHGAPSGDRKHQPLIIIKEVDVATPLIYSICVNAELLTEVKLDYYIQVGNTPDPVPFFSWTLNNAYVVSVRSIPATEMSVEFSDRYDLLEEVAFAYQQITWEHHAHRHPAGLIDLDQQIQADAWAGQA